MKTLYHHTSFDAFESIVTHKGLNFRASRYSNYTNGEYEWIKDKAYTAVKEMCQEQGVSFENDPLDFNPYIICFCEEGFSKKMWNNYAKDCRGIQIGMDADELLNKSLPDQNPNVFVKCAYISEKQSEDNTSVKRAINQIYSGYKAESVFQDDLLLCASCIKQKEFEYEKEYRYMLPLYNVIHAFLDKNGEVVFSEEMENNQNVEVNGDWKYSYECFPKDALVSVRLGHMTIDEQLEKVRQYLINSGYNIDRICIERVEENLLL